MKVFVYFNLHRKLWSVKALDGKARGKVIAHCERVIVRGASFKVSEAGRQRVLREGRKNVHAGIVGELESFDGMPTGSHPLYPYLLDGTFGRDDRAYMRHGATQPRVTYNPYKGAHFVNADTGETVERAEMVTLGKNRAVHFFDPALMPC